MIELLFFLMFLLFRIWFGFLFPYVDLKGIHRNGTSKYCRIIGFSADKSLTGYSTFLDEDGNSFTVRRSWKDYIGRETELYIYRLDAVRKDFEPLTLSFAYWMLVLFLAIYLVLRTLLLFL